MNDDKNKDTPKDDCPPDWIPDEHLTPASVQKRRDAGRQYDPNAKDPAAKKSFFKKKED